MYRLLIAAILLGSISVPVSAGDAEIRNALQKRFGDIKIESIARTPLSGVWEVFANGQILYTDETGNYVFVDAKLVDIGKHANLTEQRLHELTFVRFQDLPFDFAIKQVKGDGARKLAIFVDPDCPYCRQLQKELEKVDNITIYYFLFPLGSVHPNAPAMARVIWCAPDREKAWLDYMTRQIKPKAVGNCDTPVDKIIAFGDHKGVTGTPTLFFGNNQRVASLVTAEQIEQVLKLPPTE